MPQDRILLGVALMLGFAVTAPIMDSFAKLASDTIPVGQIVAARFVLQVVVLLPLAWAAGELFRPGLRDTGLHLLRALALLVATTAFFAALKTLPLAEAIAIFFVEPFILTLLSAVLLGETVGWRRVLACMAGFSGALLVIRPSFAAFGTAALLPLCTAFCFACYMVLTRRIARRVPPVALQGWTALAACMLVLPLLVLFQGSGVAGLDPVTPAGRDWGLLLGVGVAATVSHLFLSAALRFAPASTIAPLQYMEIVTATILGYVLFGDLFDAQALLGVAIITGSGLYVFLRERKLSRAPVPPP
ncbi:threonine/homoserine efflux transporter RhtA [Rhodovulum imhoffii]|uniref:Threonine/homoserine efflux transporter RhtA n=1 Tax=Rhodovulum imhoffii TaxID=365340 RepID=A0A2T5BQP4_9RHOB|nr:DMT family transporter [Rhodovulum imhoffii]MBK5933876.1 EamA family transporter [Rhodovulum imhoffii]PTN01536.1 threonine/homoserine efflux transporter RhtA [Rhodovulum imhoffii]